VAAGDTLTLIAVRYGMTLETLYELNDLTEESFLSVGQAILLGRVEGEVQPNSTAAVAGFPGTRIRPDGTIAHVVVAGDTLISIAIKYNMTLEELYEISGLTENDLLRIGQEVVVGHLSEPEEVGGSVDTPASATPLIEATPTPMASPTASPPPAQAAVAAILTATAPPPLIASATPISAGPIVVGSSGVLPVLFGIVGLLAVTGVLFLYLAHRHSRM
jgi:LysM repeat protein